MSLGKGGGGGGAVVASHGCLHAAKAPGLRVASAPHHGEVAPSRLVAPHGPSYSAVTPMPRRPVPRRASAQPPDSTWWPPDHLRPPALALRPRRPVIAAPAHLQGG
jgi:hypothetical protein